MRRYICVSLILLLTASFSSAIYAYNITFNIGAFGTVVATGTVSEGETYVVPERTLPIVVAQPYWDAIEGMTLTVPSGAIDSDIIVNIEVTNVDMVKGGFLELGGEKVFLSLDCTVEGYEAGFDFQKPMVLTLPLDAEILFLLQFAGLDLSSRLTLAYWTGTEFILIPTSQTATELSAEIPHLSTIVGKQAPPVSVQSGTWGMIKSLFR